MSKAGTVQLSNGVSMPAIVFGTGTLAPTDDLQQEFINLFSQAIKLGYRHFDCAGVYKTQPELGIALKQSGIAREEFYITTKIRPQLYKGQSWEAVLTQYNKELQVDYVDAFLIHNPFFNEENSGVTIETSWYEMEKLQKLGLTKSIGISNYRPVDIERVIKVATIKPTLNEMELNPYCFEQDTVASNTKNGIITLAYSPLNPIGRQAGGPLPAFLEKLVAEKYTTRTPAQLLLRWNLQNGMAFVSSSTKESRMIEQLDILDWDLEKEDLEEITKIGAEHFTRFFGWGNREKVYGDEEGQTLGH